MAKKLLLITLSLFLVLSLFSCNDEKEGSEGITVVTTLFPQYDFARAVLGDKGNVKLLLTPGADSHSFELTASDISDINCCDIFVYTGPNMEIWVDGIVDSISNRVNIVNLSAAIDLSHGDDNIDNNDEHEHNHGNDPHIWTSPVIAIDMLTKIYSAICEVDEENTEYYTANYNTYKSQLEALDQEFRNISSNSKEKTLYFSGKFAFQHFVDEYGFDYIAPFNSCSDMQVEDLASIANLIDNMKENNVGYIFYEEFASPDMYSTIVNETGAQAFLLHSAHNVSKSEYEKGITYIDIMTSNANNLKKALIDGKTT